MGAAVTPEAAKSRGRPVAPNHVCPFPGGPKSSRLERPYSTKERTIGGRPLRAPAEVVFVYGEFHP
jgi:hypothetical protein